MAAIPRPFTILASGRVPGGVITGLNGQTITGDANGAWTVTANGTNQNVTLTPSGTGGITLSGSGLSGSGLLRFPTGTTSAQGISFSDALLYRSGTRTLEFGASGGNPIFSINNIGNAAHQLVGFGTGLGVNGLNSVFLQSNGTTVFQVDSATNATIIGTKTLKFGDTAAATIGVSANTTAGNLVFTPTSTGGFVFGGTATATFGGRIVVGAADSLMWNGRSTITSSADGTIKLGDNSTTAILTAAGVAGTTLTGGAGNMTITSGTGNSRTMSLQTTTSGGVATDAIVIGDTQLITKYGNVTTAGWGVPAIQGNGTIAATTNARSAAVAAYTVGAADGTFVVSGNILITTSTAFSFSLDCSYTDEGNVARVLILPLAQLAGTFVASGLATNITGAGPYESASMTIRCKASTAITIRPSSGGTYTTVVYNVNANIRQVA